MISGKDLYFLEKFDKATPIKELIKENNSTIVYRTIGKFLQAGVIVKKKGKPIRYDTTITGGGLMLMLQKVRGLL